MKKSLWMVVALVFSIQVAQLYAQAPAAAPGPAPRAAKDQQARAKGDQYRTYSFPGTGETIQYRLFVPSSWNPNTKLPVLVELHAGGTVDLPFIRGEGTLTKVAEQRGYIVIAPLGYKIAGGSPSVYNAPWSIIRAPATPPAPAAANANANPAPSPPGNAPPPITAQDRQRAEQDVLNTIDLVVKEYNADTSRIYLHGNSFAAVGVWYFAQKYPERFAAIAVSSGGISPETYPFERLKSVPTMVVHGTDDATMSFDAALKMALTAKEKGVNVEWFPVLKGTHLEAWTMGFNQILDFFGKHKKN